MITLRQCGAIVACSVLLSAPAPAPAPPTAPPDPLPSWNDSSSKRAILDFVRRVTTKGGAEFVPVAERIAVFDNDGTLWSEQPMYFQFTYAFDRVRALAPQHPEWATTQPYKAVLDGDSRAFAATGERGLAQVFMKTHTGQTAEQFAQEVTDWINRARHPRFDRPYTQLVFQPMLELLAFFRANDFKTYIVSAGTVEWIRAWAEPVYGVPPEQVLGTTFATRLVTGPDGTPTLLREPRIDFVSEGPGKPVGINRFIGRRPIVAFGNSDGDLQMLQWTAAGPGARLMGLIHHTDSVREWKYDRQSNIGRLDRALDEATSRKWTVVDMKNEWKVVYPFELLQQALDGARR